MNIAVVTGLVEVVLVDYITQSKPFTYHDIKMEARKRTTGNVKHDDVKTIVDNYMIAHNVLYEKTFATLQANGKTFTASVFHPTGTPVSIYSLVCSLGAGGVVLTNDPNTLPSDTDLSAIDPTQNNN